MKSNTKQVREAVKNLIIEKGANNILNRHITEVVENETAIGKTETALARSRA